MNVTPIKLRWIVCAIALVLVFALAVFAYRFGYRAGIRDVVGGKTVADAAILVKAMNDLEGNMEDEGWRGLNRLLLRDTYTIGRALENGILKENGIHQVDEVIGRYLVEHDVPYLGMLTPGWCKEDEDGELAKVRLQMEDSVRYIEQFKGKVDHSTQE